MLNLYKLTIFIFLLSVSGCQLLTEPAPLLTMPNPPKLKSNSYNVRYLADASPLQIKSVQLPARPLVKGQTISLANATIEPSSELFSILNEQFSTLGLSLLSDTTLDSDYRLTLTKLEFIEGDKISYQLQNAANQPNIVQQKFAQQSQYSCASVKGTVGIRLTNTKTGNVVWFATASADNTTLGQTELTYQLDWAQIISNKKEVKQFIDEQNTEQARLLRANVPISIPQYQVSETISVPRLISGYCGATDDQAISQRLQTYLLTELINKLNVT
ncbi:hypothetical protein [Pseudoalteromonas tunicata]|uniref:Putative orphan protein putative signal peptide n=1 Tax=Pseudoalteromonas tunicata D2 TaxID=87626 RepID=A4CD70_9GAMM|nr:hypothetical protein [Pseudoalteromonas tunicata]ATC94020.1 hypothetical protein PTUN_a1384 [Pseudoalteromonas tunicata]AXT29803.1 hypothetical protein D1819_02500 [Pseudoalteromonas tunicata]EAR27513.1 putative orphan protein; putative signal peptide [Pseudoalteromonas tunicata D2]MDP4984026.1 hypothetical protein [Pseudoalteromonas tunicata]MDP5213753.1 hypothetical protein [Pseudoalteromonas tunicata]